MNEVGVALLRCVNDSKMYRADYCDRAASAIESMVLSYASSPRCSHGHTHTHVMQRTCLGYRTDTLCLGSDI